MGGITMWIILGVLITIVICFLIGSAILDKKKRKKEKIIFDKEQNDKLMASGKVAILMNLLVAFNEAKLKKFVPSVGKEKMSDINNYAKKEFDKIKKQKLFKLIADKPETLENFLMLAKTKSNNWKKQCSKAIEFFAKTEKELSKTAEKEEFKIFKKEASDRLKKEYK